jgi:hypothetical protein
MMTHRLQVLAGCPYFTTSKVKNDDDRKFQQVAWALKDGKTIAYSGKYIPAAQWFADWVARRARPSVQVEEGHEHTKADTIAELAPRLGIVLVGDPWDPSPMDGQRDRK